MRLELQIDRLNSLGVEVLKRPSGSVTLPKDTIIEIPASLKWTHYEHSLELGAFSYQVSGFCSASRIGRYCSFGEQVQIGRQNHPIDWISTSPSFYLNDKIFSLGRDFYGSEEFHSQAFKYSRPPTNVRITNIGHDVWIGHGAFIAAGVSIGHGAIIGGASVVTKDVPPYAIAVGAPAVVKKYRFSHENIQRMLKLQWWRFAPWQLQHLDPSKIDLFLDGVEVMSNIEPFQFRKLVLSEIF